MKFTPKKIEVNQIAYTKAVKDAEEKLNNFKEALDWVYSNNVSEVDDMAFNNDMLTEYKRCFMLQNSNVVKLDISFEKLLDLLDVNLQILKEFQYKHDDNKSELVQIDKETVATKIDINDYTIWTRNESENERLDVANELINVLDKVGSFSKVYPLTITQGISNFLLFDTAKHQYKVNRTIIPKPI
tara:strand:- start:238 stop:795 length:558 start_codon:yes stop_codon:yes gene_type:complete